MIRIVTDSTCDLSKDQVQHYGISAVANLHVNFGPKTYEDGVTINNQQFYELLKTDPNFPSTSQPSVGDFAAIYERFKADDIISIHASRDLSGTIASAEAARDMVGGRITIIDSRNINAGLALLVIHATRMAQAGSSAAEIKSTVEAMAPRTRLIFSLETLENLRRGGRIGAAQALLGGVLQFKPIITIKDGRLEPVERVRTLSKAILHLRDMALQDLGAQKARQIAIMHAAAPAAANELLTACKQSLQLDEIIIIEVGPVVATHSGPGAVGMAYTI